MTNTVNITVNNVTPEQVAAITALLEGKATKGNTSLAGLATGSKRGSKKTSSKKAPEKTVSPDEDEDFGEEELDEEELDAQSSDDPADFEDEDADEDADEDEEDEEDEEEETEEEDELDFDTVRSAINKYGNTHPKEMKTIYSGFNLKNSKELQRNKKKWEPVYRKVMAALKKVKTAPAKRTRK